MCGSKLSHFGILKSHKYFFIFKGISYDDEYTRSCIRWSEGIGSASVLEVCYHFNYSNWPYVTRNRRHRSKYKAFLDHPSLGILFHITLTVCGKVWRIGSDLRRMSRYPQISIRILTSEKLWMWWFDSCGTCFSSIQQYINYSLFVTSKCQFMPGSSIILHNLLRVMYLYRLALRSYN